MFVARLQRLQLPKPSFRLFSTFNPLNPLAHHHHTMPLPRILEQHRPKESPETDYSTLSNYKDFKVNHSTFDIALNFDAQNIVGSIKYDLTCLSSTVSKIMLDTSFLKINSITIDNEVREFEIRERSEPLGSALEIPYTSKSNSKFELLLNFETTKQSTAIQWLKTNKDTTDPSDYVFTQLEPIHARSLFPCFDTPSVKSTFTASIKSKQPVVFSGLPVETKEEHTYKFEQKIPIPSYLIAIAAGDIVSAKVGPRSTIYAEPSVLKDATHEFESDVENFIQIAEKIVTPYIWTTYDFLINPASFPYGGMENPNITFVTPTLISYDKSQVDVIAHELAHSWSGNNVTNASWEHFYLNEGWTVYLERRITSFKDGKLDERFRHFQYIQGWNDLVNSIEALPKFEYSKLVQDLNKGQIDPDDTFSSVPYEKGSNLLFHLEQALGGVEAFDPFIKFYFTKFSQKSLDTYQFVDSLYEFYGQDESKLKILNDFDWELWLYTAGLPPKYPFDTTLVDQVSELVDKWVSKATEFTTVDQFKQFFASQSAIYDSFSSPQRILFIDTILEANTNDFWLKNSVASDALLDVYPDLNSSKNTEIISRWFKFKLASGKTQYHQDLANWLGTVGRMKYVRPGYKQLDKVNHELAVETFKKYQDFYHPIAANLVKKDLGLA